MAVGDAQGVSEGLGDPGEARSRESVVDEQQAAEVAACRCVDAALTAARHRLPGARPEDDSVLSA